MQTIQDADDDDDAVPDEPGWRTTLANIRARMREELGDQTIDVSEIIREMREERDIQLLTNISGEDRAIAMVWGRSDEGNPQSSDS